MEGVGDEDDVNATGHDVDGQQRVLDEGFNKIGVAFRPRSSIFEDNFAGVGVAEQGIFRFSADFLRARDLMSKSFIFMSI